MIKMKIVYVELLFFQYSVKINIGFGQLKNLRFFGLNCIPTWPAVKTIGMMGNGAIRELMDEDRYKSVFFQRNQLYFY